VQAYDLCPLPFNVWLAGGGRLEVTWRRGGKRIGRHASRRRVGVDDLGVLRVDRTRRRDAGRYICQVTDVETSSLRLKKFLLHFFAFQRFCCLSHVLRLICRLLLPM